LLIDALTISFRKRGGDKVVPSSSSPDQPPCRALGLFVDQTDKQPRSFILIECASAIHAWFFSRRIFTVTGTNTFRARDGSLIEECHLFATLRRLAWKETVDDKGMCTDASRDISFPHAALPQDLVSRYLRPLGRDRMEEWMENATLFGNVTVTHRNNTNVFTPSHTGSEILDHWHHFVRLGEPAMA